MTELDQLMEVMEAAFDPHWREAWTRDQVANSLAMPSTYALICDSKGTVAKDGNSAAGFILARRAPGEEELLLVAVRPEFRRQGIGKALLALFFERARENGADSVFLEMRVNNPAVSLYQDMGFEVIGRRPAYYRTAEGEPLDAVTFARKL